MRFVKKEFIVIDLDSDDDEDVCCGELNECMMDIDVLLEFEEVNFFNM